LDVAEETASNTHEKISNNLAAAETISLTKAASIKPLAKNVLAATKSSNSD